ncbi:peptidase inhibitor family I36 protein [Streptomyces sp. NPDC004647]|uniref:peptidase inhibitor family I36 protein n=1 Tax=Streptomyces sp. NPDC004647 TaxID=3154671 RepID=UPI0033BC9DE7
MRKIALAGATLALAATAAVVTPTSALAAGCGSGSFCAWTSPNYGGDKAEWTGDDSTWGAPINDNDESWANYGVSGPGVQDHVQVWNGWGGRTICLAPGQAVGSNPGAANRGGAHTWEASC